MHRIFHDFTYDPTATNVSTPVDEVLAHRRGVCQDFAHLAISCLRSLGLPARYVSGYLVTGNAGGAADGGRRRVARLGAGRTVPASAGSTSIRPTTSSRGIGT